MTNWFVVYAVLMTLAVPRPAEAEAPGCSGPCSTSVSTESRPRRSIGKRVGLGLAGVATAFVGHELGHVTANLMMGNVPHFSGIMVGGFIPFVAITPGITCDGDHCVKRNGETFGPGRRGKYFIVTAGFHAQHITDEVLLSLWPELRQREAAFYKGLLAFNLFLSAFYAAGAWTGLEDPHGDLDGAGEMSGIDTRVLATFLMLPAVLDTCRYFFPGTRRWLPWVSRGSKLLFLGVNFTW